MFSKTLNVCVCVFHFRLMLPYEEHLRSGGAEFRIPETPLPPKPRGIRGRKPLPRGRKPGPKAKEKKTPAPAPPPQTVSNRRNLKVFINDEIYHFAVFLSCNM